MSNRDENIKKDLIALYEDLYGISQNEAAKNVFNSRILKRLKYNPKEIKQVLAVSSPQVSEPKKTRISPEISVITTKEEVRAYFEENLMKLYQPDVSEDEKKDILKKISLEEIKYLYQIIFGISLTERCRKEEAVYKLRDFFENEKGDDGSGEKYPVIKGEKVFRGKEFNLINV